MNENKKKDWIKNAAIIFLIIMLLLTLFSNTIRNYSLPQVSAASVMSMDITESVRGSGTVETADPYTVKATEARKISSVAVKKGDHVDIGDPILYLADVESKELQEAEEAVSTAEKEFYTNMFASTVDADTITKIRSGNYDSISKMQSEVKHKQDQMDAMQATIYEYNNQIDVLTILQQIENKNLDWNNMSEVEQKALLEEEQKKLGNYKDYLTDVGSSDAFSNEDKARQKEIKDLLAEITTADTLRKSSVDNQKADTKLEIDNLTKIRDNAKAALEVLKTEKTDLDNQIKTQIEMQYKAVDIEDKKAKVEKLKAQAMGATVTAEVAGIIKSIDKVAGESTEAGKDICVILPDGKGKIITATFDTSKVKRIKVGDTAQLLDSWMYGEDISFKVKSIADDPDNSGKKSILTFDVDTDVLKDGDNVNIVLGSSTKTCDKVVPSSAIRNDNSGDYVYKLVEKSSPLGNRYIVQKVSITKDVFDDTNTAIMGDIGLGDFVVTQYNKPIENSGQEVRLSEGSDQ